MDPINPLHFINRLIRTLNYFLRSYNEVPELEIIITRLESDEEFVLIALEATRPEDVHVESREGGYNISVTKAFECTAALVGSLASGKM